MKVKKILPFVLSFCLLFGSVSSLYVKAADPINERIYKAVSCDDYSVKFGFSTGSAVAPSGWWTASDKIDSTTYSLQTVHSPNPKYLYFVFESLNGSFLKNKGYRLRIDFPEPIFLSLNLCKSIKVFSATDSDHLLDRVDVKHTFICQRYINDSDFMTRMDCFVSAYDAISNFFVVRVELYTDQDPYLPQSLPIQFNFARELLPGELEDTPEEETPEEESTQPSEQPTEEPTTRDPVQDAIDQGNQQAHEDASKVEDAIQQGNDQAHEDANEQKNLLSRIVDGILGLPKKIIDGFIDGLKNLFIPDPDKVNEIITDIQDTFSDAFGFLSYPFDLLGKVLDLFLKAGGDAVITVPEWRFMDHVVIPEYTYNLSQNEIIKLLLPYIRSLTSCILAWNFIGLCRRKYDEVIKGGGS